MTSRELVRGSGFRVGEYRCTADDRAWRCENWIGERAHVVFPGPAVGIRQADREPLVATPNEVVLYNGGTSYRRSLLSGEGDHSVFVELEPELAEEVGPFAVTAAPVGPGSYVFHRRLARRGDVDPMEADERVLAVLAAVPAASDQCEGRLRRPARDAAEAAKAVIAARLAERFTLADVAAAVHYSPFHLARVFRVHTGHSLCDYRTQLRVRRAVDRVLDPRESLAAIAADLGFASHSHLTTAFRRVLGMTPAQLRSH